MRGAIPSGTAVFLSAAGPQVTNWNAIYATRSDIDEATPASARDGL
jgi:hypothetical protein